MTVRGYSTVVLFVAALATAGVVLRYTVFFDARQLVVDGWSRDFLFEESGTTLRIVSFGENQVPGGDGADADIIRELPIE